jgi:hypothetical protein
MLYRCYDFFWVGGFWIDGNQAVIAATVLLIDWYIFINISKSKHLKSD